MSASKLDAVYRSMLLTKFFTKGWGKPENLRRLFEFRKIVSNRDKCFTLVEKDYPVTITKEQNLADCKLIEGYFLSPLEKCLPGIVPEIAQKAHFQIVLPIHWPDPHCKPVCLHLAGTGDHFFWRRRNLMVKPLLKEAGIGGIILENPFYGLRKPTDQIRSSLHNVSDIFVMGGCLILESLVLFHWCERNGLGPLGVTGLSMGGHMASLAATNWPKPLVLVPCLSWSTASAVFLQGVMSQSINWDLLEDQYLSDGVYREKLSKMVTIVDEAFLAGKKFARTYSNNFNSTPNTQTITQDPIVDPLKCSPFKNLDITYKESSAKGNAQVLDINENVIGFKPEVPDNVKSVSSEQKKIMKDEWKKLLNDNKISQVLYDKLTSNKTFELDAQDIVDINKLDDGQVKDLLLKFTSDVKKGALLEKVKVSELSEPNETKQMTVDINNNAKNISPVEHDSSDTKSVVAKEDSSKTNILDDKTAKLESKQTAVNDNPNLPAIKEGKDDKLEKKSWNLSDLTSDLWINLPFMKSSGKKIDISKIHWRDREALQFMRGIMDECTHLSNFSIPFDTSLIIAVCAKHDAYVPREDVGTLEEIWPGAEVRYVDAGHVSAYILHQSLFRSCIKEAFERSKKKWKDGKHVD
ncbi:protein ABHD18 isoform X1 [Pararge aegeria]|uniref:Jg10897 protein n=2 Tax=Pararge aegeria TaxID=116150 RepID=A0A8S4SF20_9NEOP|nr:protein ABHD18 isoform X1 [Pararge aegeria]CAH2263562.1 jg10897 [Pararge aegeria aegeria]